MKLLIIAAVLFSFASCTNSVSPVDNNSEGSDTMKQFSGNTTIIEGVFAGDKQPDTLRIESGKYCAFTYYMSFPDNPKFWEPRTDVKVNLDDGKVYFPSYGYGIKYRLVFFE